MNELWNSLGELGQLAVGLGTIAGVVVIFKAFSWVMEKLDE